LIDLTKAGAKKLGFIKQGLTKVKIEAINESVVFRP
jgi:rare lipoprotein A (peptidoglycan hydrolase)